MGNFLGSLTGTTIFSISSSIRFSFFLQGGFLHLRLLQGGFLHLFLHGGFLHLRFFLQGGFLHFRLHGGFLHLKSLHRGCPALPHFFLFLPFPSFGSFGLVSVPLPLSGFFPVLTTSSTGSLGFT